MTIISNVQTTYDIDHAPAFAGQIATLVPYDISTFFVKAGETIAPGKGVQLDAVGSRDAILAADVAKQFIGVAVRILDAAADSSRDIAYQEKTNINLLEKGEIWVVVQEAVLAGNPVALIHGVANFGDFMTTDDATSVLVPNARFLTDQASVGGLAKIKIPAAIRL